MFNEWELLTTADEIEPGDCLTVEADDGGDEVMVFLRQKNRFTIELLDSSGNKREYSVATLEEHGDGNTYITGKSDVVLSAQEILRAKKEKNRKESNN